VNKFIIDHLTTVFLYVVAVSRFVAVFETPAKVTLQVYRALLRSHNTTEKNIVRAALNVMVPALPKRLSPDELENALKYTAKIMHEEGNSVQQLTHLLECVSCHPEVYYRYSSLLLPQMIYALSVLGVSQNSSTELKELSITATKIIFEWNERKQDIAKSPNTPENSHIVNFLTKIILLNAEGPSSFDISHRQIHSEAISLLKHIVSSDPNVILSEIHFERVSALKSGVKEVPPMKHSQEKAGDAPKKGEKIAKKPLSQKEANTQNTEDNENTNAPMIVHASLEILSVLFSCNSMDSLNRLNTCKILSDCYLNDPSIKNKGVQKLLNDCFVHLFTAGGRGLDNSALITLLESSIIAASSAGEKSEEQLLRGYLAIDIIEKVCITSPDFIEPFTGSLISFAREEVKAHLQGTSTLGDPYLYDNLHATPTVGIFELACGIGCQIPNTKDLPFTYEVSQTQTFVEIEDLKPSIRALIQAIRLLSKSSNLLITFSTPRETFLEVLSRLLAYSASIPLLMTVIGIVRNVVTASNLRSHFTRSEKEELLLRAAQIEFNKLPNAAANVLLDMICCIVVSLYGYDPSIVTKETELIPKNEHLANASGVERVMNKIFPICLMSGNLALRSVAVSMFALGVYDYKAVQQMLTSAANYNDREEDSIGIWGIPGKSPYDIIRQFMQADLEYLGKRMWTVVLLDLLLAVGKHTGGLHCPHRGYHGLRHKPDSKNTREIDLKVVDEGVYSAFVKLTMLEKSEENHGRGRCISAIRKIIYGDVATSQSVLESCFQVAWLQLPSDEERFVLTQSIEKVLAMPYHSQFLKTSQCTGPSNVVHSVLRLMFHVRPLPTMDSFLLSSLAVDYNLRYEVLAFLERQYLTLVRSGSKDSPDFSFALENIYESFASLGYRDATLAILSASCSLPGTKFALSLDMYGEVKKSTNAYMSLINTADADKNSEVSLWSRRWVEAHKELRQWPLVDELASTLRDTNLMIESAWKTKNFEKVKSLHGYPSIIGSMESGDSLVKMTEIFLAIHEGRLGEVESLHAQAANLCLYKWKLLPTVKPGSGGAHVELYQQFQRLGECLLYTDHPSNIVPSLYHIYTP
jgi:hypothetical protein